MRLQKFGRIVDGEEQKFSYSGTWADERTTGPDRLVVAPEHSPIALIQELISILNGPFWLLYVLEVARADGEPGRYQAPEPLSAEQVGEFLKRFCDFFEEDGRHELWIGSCVSDAQIIYDNHDVLYLYGPLDSFIMRLGQHNIARADKVECPFPHYHHYWSMHDASQSQLLAAFEWTFSLPPEH